MGVIRIRDLVAKTVIGVDEGERRAPRDVTINLALETDLDPAASSDDLADAVDYASVAKRVADHAASARYRLLETLAGALADLILEHEPAVTAVTVTVDKAATVPGARSVAVELHRAR